MGTTSITQPLNVLSIGASRNIGYFTSLKLLHAGAKVTFLLRNPSVFDDDTSIQTFISSAHACIVKGDALVKEDVTRAWTEAINQNNQNHVDFLLFTLGGTPTFSLTKGFTITPPNLVTLSLLNVLSTLPPTLLTSTDPIKIITISSTGLTPSSHSSLPTLIKPLYKFLLPVPHTDKVATERVLHHLVHGWNWTATSADANDPSSTLLPTNWQATEGLPSAGSLKHVVVVRPSLLLDGECKGDKYDELKKQGEQLPAKSKKARLPYRVSTEQELGGYSISRKDVAHFLVDLILNRWAEFENKIVNISE